MVTWKKDYISQDSSLRSMCIFLEASLNGEASFVFPSFPPIGCSKDMIIADWTMGWKSYPKVLCDYGTDLATLYNYLWALCINKDK